MWQYIYIYHESSLYGPSKVRPPPFFFGMLCQYISDIIGRTGGLLWKQLNHEQFDWCYKVRRYFGNNFPLGSGGGSLS